MTKVYWIRRLLIRVTMWSLVGVLLLIHNTKLVEASHDCADWHFTNISFLMDYSSSMGGSKATLARTVALGVLNELSSVNRLDRAGGIGFPDKWSLPVNSANIALLKSRIMTTQSDGSSTPLYDAIVFGASNLASLSVSGKKLLVVITDGIDDGSNNQITQAAFALSNSGASNYLVFTGGSNDPGHNTLQGLASSSGSTFFSANSGTAASTIADLILAGACKNYRPHAAMTISDTILHLGVEGFTITFNGSGSTDKEDGSHSHLNFRWQLFDPNGQHVATVTGATPGTSSTIDMSFSDSWLPGEVWSMRLTVTDSDDASDSINKTFRVIGSLPDITINGATSIDATDTIVLDVTPEDDVDGGVLSIVWDIVQSPPGAQHAPQSNFSTGTTLDPIITTDQDIGTWVFRATATDNEGDQDVEEITVEVKNIPPEIELSAPSEIGVGESITATTNITDDIDGGILTFQWDIVQAPQSAPQTVTEAFSEGTGSAGASIAPITTTGNHAGTWIFRLTAKDDDEDPDSSEVSEEFEVLVDALPEAIIRCSTCTDPTATDYGIHGVIASPTFPLELDSGDSVDPDSPPPPPCPGSEADHCHDTLDGRDVVVSPGLERVWSLNDFPSELNNIQTGRVDDPNVLGVTATGTVMSPDIDLAPGNWQFQVSVEDGEGNETYTTYNVNVVDEGGPPKANISGPARFTTDLSGNLSEDIVVSGFKSLDPDNILNIPAGEDLGPGSGISNYEWEILQSPANCALTAGLPTEGPTLHTVTLFPANTVIASDCQGVWRIGLQVTDDDNPSKFDSAETTLIIGNCPEPLCIDYPKANTPYFVEFSDATDIFIQYHLDSALYDDPQLAFGTASVLQVFHEDDLTEPVYTSPPSYNVLASDKGSSLVFHWNGFGNTTDGMPVIGLPQPGRYWLQISLHGYAADFMLGPPVFTTIEPEAIWIEVIEPEILSTSDKYINHDELSIGAEQINLDYSFSGSGPPDELCWSVFNEADINLVTECTTSPQFSGGTITWDGLLSSSTTISPGNYTVELEAFRAGASLGVSVPYALVVYKMALTPSTGPVSATPPGLFVFVNTDDDNRNNVSDLTEVDVVSEDDLIGFNITIEPFIEGIATLSSVDPVPPFKVWDPSTGPVVEVPLPAMFNVPADPVPSQLLIEGLNADQSNLSLEFQTWDGVILDTVTIALTMVEVQVMTDTNNDHAISAGDVNTYHVQIARWDNAYDGAFNVRNNADPDNFVDQDPSRFYLRVRDPSANTDPAVAEQITIRVGTLDAAVAVDDNLTEVTLVENAINSGEFISRSQILTSHDLPTSDDNFAAHDGSMAAVADDTVGDRTHRTVIDGSVHLEYVPAGASTARTWNLPVCNRSPEERRILEINITVFNEPYRDVGYDHDLNPMTPDIAAGNATFDFTDADADGIHDVGEPSEPFMDLSSGAGVFSLGGSRGGVVTSNQANAQVERANISWAQACIKMVVLSTTFVDAPTNSIGVDILADGLFDATDTAVVISTFAPDASADVVEIFFVAPIIGANAFTRTPSDVAAGLGEKTFSFIEPNLNLDFRTLAHELGHAMDNDWDSPNPQTIFYPATNTFLDNAVNSYRRVTLTTVSDVRTIRAAGDMMGIGNRLLKSP